MLAEFKEKSYEKFFGHELARQTNVTFSPDQCDEFFLGIDEAFLLPWPFLEEAIAAHGTALLDELGKRGLGNPAGPDEAPPLVKLQISTRAGFERLPLRCLQ